MPKIGFKIKFKNLPSVKDDIFIVTFDLQYKNDGSLIIQDNCFDCGYIRILLEKVTDDLTYEVFKKYDNGIYYLSICKYIVDNVPNIYSIQIESLNNRDTYFKQEIIDDYTKISKTNK